MKKILEMNGLVDESTVEFIEDQIKIVKGLRKELSDKKSLSLNVVEHQFILDNLATTLISIRFLLHKKHLNE